MSSVQNTDELIEVSIATAQREKLLNNGDLVVVTAGVPVEVSGSTNILKAQVVGDRCLDHLKL